MDDDTGSTSSDGTRDDIGSERSPKTEHTVTSSIRMLGVKIHKTEKLVFGERPQSDKKAAGDRSRVSNHIATIKRLTGIMKEINIQLELL